MKKLLACVLALSFCTATVEAGLLSGVKNKVKNVVSKSKNNENKEIKTWLKNLKTLISNVIPDVKEIKNNMNNSEVIANADGLKAVLEDGKKNPLTIMNYEIDIYIKEIKKLGVNVSKFSTSDNNSTNYGKLTKVIKEYKDKYNGNLASMETATNGIYEIYKDDVPMRNTVGKLSTALVKYKNLSNVINDADSEEISKAISMFSEKLGSDHNYIKILIEGVTYLKNHAKYKKLSDEMAQSFLKRFNNKLKNATKKVSNVQNKLNIVTNKIDSVKSDTIDSLKSNIINNNSNNIEKSALYTD